MWNFKRLEAWQRTRRLIVDIYQLTSLFPKSEQFGMTTQMRRAANSIGANIAEGCAREGGKDRARFLETSIASGHELDHHLILVSDVGLADPDRTVELIGELEQIRKMTTALRLRSLNGPRNQRIWPNLKSDV